MKEENFYEKWSKMSNEERDQWRENELDKYEKQGIITSRMFYKLHKCCPECGKVAGQTYFGVIDILGENFIDDQNVAMCSCGWTGKVIYLVSEKDSKI